MAAKERTLESWAETVSQEAKSLTSFLVSNSYYEPSFEQAGWQDYPELSAQAQMSRRKLMEAAKAVYDLAAGPRDYMKLFAWSYHDLSTLRWLVHFHVPEAIPVHGSATIPQIAEACKVDESRLRRILRYAMTNRLFTEPQLDCVAHSSFSSMLVTDPALKAWVEYGIEEALPASGKLVEAYEKRPDSEAPKHAAYALAHETEEMSLFEYLSQPGKEARAKRWSDMIAQSNNTPGYELKFTVEAYDWRSLTGLLVDVGGGTGDTAVALAKAFPNLKVIVEDLPHVASEGEQRMPVEFKDRVSFAAHDFFQLQPDEVMARKPAAFMLRQVIHNYAEQYAKRIIKRLIPAMEKGSKMLIVDMVLPPPGALPPSMEKVVRVMDIEMMQSFNGVEREVEDWKMLLAATDKRLQVASVNQPEGSALSLIEVVLRS